MTQSLRTLARRAKELGMQLAVSVCDAGSPDPGRYRHQLIGPTSRALAVLEPLRGEGCDPLGVALDTARLRLNSEGPEAVALLAPYLQWFHFGN